MREEVVHGLIGVDAFRFSPYSMEGVGGVACLRFLVVALEHP
jgi:hypothetical protein